MSDFSPKAARLGRAITWILLVGVSVAGAGMAAMSPLGQQRLQELVANLSNGPAVEDRSVSAMTTNMVLSAELEQRLASIEASIERLGGNTIESSDRIKDLNVAVAGLKEQLGQVTGSVATDVATTVLERNQPSGRDVSSGSIEVETVMIGPGGIAEADRADDVSETPFVTPMVNLAVPASPPVLSSGAPAPIPVPTILVTDFGIELARAGTIDELEREWKRLSGSQKKAMSRLEPRISLDFSSSNAAKLVLIAGPIRNAGDAARLCAMLAAAGETCRTVPFGEDTVALNGQP